MYLVCLPFQQASWKWGRLTASDLFLIVALCASLGNIRRARFQGSPFLLLLLCYGAACTISAVFSQAPIKAGMEAIKVLYLVILAAVFYLSTESSEDLVRWVRAFLAGSLLCALASLWAWFQFFIFHKTSSSLLSNMGSLPKGDYPRVCSTFDFATMFCNYMLVSFCLACLYWRLKKTRRRFLLVGATLFAAGTSLSAGIGGLGLAFTWLLLEDYWKTTSGSSRFSRRLYEILVIVPTGLFALFMLIGGTFGVKTLFFNSWKAKGIPVRLHCWAQAGEAWADAPLLGWGGGQEPILVITNIYQFANAHNWVLSTASQWGTVGLLPLLGMVFYLLGFHRPPTRSKIVFHLRVALCAALLYHGWMASVENARHLWVLFGLLAAGNRLEGLPPRRT